MRRGVVGLSLVGLVAVLAGGLAGGAYLLHTHRGSSAEQGSPSVVQTRLTIPEGFTLAQIADRVGHLPGLSAAVFLQRAQDGSVRSAFEPASGTNLEGLVFPDTYFIGPGEDERDVLQRMVDQFGTVAGEIGLGAPGPLPNGLSTYQTVIVASIIEREAKLPEDRPMIARVILNRLARHMRLQIDATVLYALGIQTTELTAEDLKFNSPYNTYVAAGLPPAPISNPGRASLLAALHPAPGPWLYYVLADANGRHAFASNAHDFAILEAQARAKGLLG